MQIVRPMRKIIGFLAFTMMVSSGQPATAQVATFADLATAISNNFPLAGTDAFAGKDWCINIESDPTLNWWYLKFNGYFDAHSSRYGKRVRLIFKNSKDEYGFASIFLGMDTLQTVDYGSQQAFQIAKTTTPQKIIFPNPSTTDCPDLAKMLPILFTESAQFWVPLGNPLCKDPNGLAPVTGGGGTTSAPSPAGAGGAGRPAAPPDQLPCATLTGADGKQRWEKQKSQNFGSTAEDDLLHWNFNGRDHLIPGAMRFLVQFCKQASPCPDPNGIASYGYLIIGYGGSGGAG